MVSFTDVLLARKCIGPYLVNTPVLESHELDLISGAKLFFKCENLQKIGAFKARGAMNAALNLPPNINHVVTHSSGNHAQALAYSAFILGLKATVVMPENAPKIKVDGVKRLGAEILFCQATLAAREATVAEVIKQTGAYLVHPFNDPRIIAGQGTAALDLTESITDLNILVAPVGGGGLLSGTGIVGKELGLRVIGAEPTGAADAVYSLESGKIEPHKTEVDTIADGLKTNLGSMTLPIICETVSDILLATDAEIVAAMKLIWNELKVIVEPSSAVALAIILKNPEVFKNQKVGIVLSGGNVDLSAALSLFS